MLYSKIDLLNAKINVLTLSLNIILYDNKVENLQKLGEILCEQTLHQLEEGGIWLWNYQTNEVYYSNNFCKTLGYNYGELGTGFDGFNLGDEEHMSIGMKMINDLIANHSIEPFINDITYKTKSNGYVNIQCIGAVFYKDNLPYIILGTHKVKQK